MISIGSKIIKIINKTLKSCYFLSKISHKSKMDIKYTILPNVYGKYEYRPVILHIRDTAIRTILYFISFDDELFQKYSDSRIYHIFPWYHLEYTKYMYE